MGKKKSKNQIAFEKAAKSKLIECQMVSVAGSKKEKMANLAGFRAFVTERFNQASDKERAGYELFLRGKIDNMQGGHPKLKKWLARILDEYVPETMG